MTTRAVGLLGLRLRGLGRLHLGGQRLGAREQRLLLVSLRLRDLLAECLLLGTEPLELGDRVASPPVGRDRVVDDVRGQPATLLGGADAVRVVSEHTRIDHPIMLTTASTGILGAQHRPVRDSLDTRRQMTFGAATRQRLLVGAGLSATGLRSPHLPGGPGGSVPARPRTAALGRADRRVDRRASRGRARGRVGSRWPPVRSTPRRTSRSRRSCSSGAASADRRRGSWS